MDSRIFWNKVGLLYLYLQKEIREGTDQPACANHDGVSSVENALIIFECLDLLWMEVTKEGDSFGIAIVFLVTVSEARPHPIKGQENGLEITG